VALPSTVAGVLVLVLVFLPGLPGDFVYRTLVGVSWREREGTKLARVLSFSVAGLLAYAILASSLNWAPADHVVPGTYTDPSFRAADIPPLAWAYFGHIAAASIAGGLGAGALRLLTRISPAAGARDAWDELIHSAVPGRWVVVTLMGGDTYLARVDHADVSAAPEHRDLILAEPYRWDSSSKQYAPTYQQHLFIRAADLASLATVYDSTKDKADRVIPVESSPFDEATDVRQT